MKLSNFLRKICIPATGYTEPAAAGFASALAPGLYSNPSRGINLFKDIKDSDTKKTEQFVNSGKVRVSLLERSRRYHKESRTSFKSDGKGG